MIHTRTILTLSLMLAITSACGEGSEGDGGMEDETAEAGLVELPVRLMARARVTVEAATTAALARVPDGEVVAGELEEESGQLIFSFDIHVEGREGIEEVHVDAMTGDIIAQEHEDGEDEEGR